MDPDRCLLLPGGPEALRESNPEGDQDGVHPLFAHESNLRHSWWVLHEGFEGALRRGPFPE